MMRVYEVRTRKRKSFNKTRRRYRGIPARTLIAAIMASVAVSARTGQQKIAGHFPHQVT